jgi:Tol biopolymer transport system component
MEQDGHLTQITTAVGPYDDVRLSPDNQKVAFVIRAANDDIWVYDFSSASLTRHTFGGGNSGLPDWTVDGQKLLFFSERGEENQIFWKPSDGSGTAERIGKKEGTIDFRMTTTPDGKSCIYGTGGDLWSVSLEGMHETKPILQDSFSSSAPRLSPDGRLLAYISDQSGRNEVYVVHYPQMNGKWQVSNGGVDNAPIWDPLGSALYYVQEGALMKVNVGQEPAIRFSAPQEMFELPQSVITVHDISRDGKKFIVTVAEESSVQAEQLTIVLNWSAELRQKFSTSK